MKIKFGTDGWRAVIAKEFTFENLSLVSVAAAAHLQKALPDRKTIFMGYDRRFLSEEFAQCSAMVFANQGFKVQFAETFLPTPTLSWCAKNNSDAAGAVVITASHNPPTYNGFKFKEIFGGSALPAMTGAFEVQIENMTDQTIEVPDPKDFQAYLDNKSIKMFDPMPNYMEALVKQVDAKAIAAKNFHVGIDPMYGSASGHFQNLLEKIGVGVTAIRDTCNPSFGGTAPEPIGKNIQELSALVSSQKLDCGFANDGDADRLGAIDENGKFFSTQKILSVVYWHMIKNRNKAWNISRSVSTTRMVDLIAKKYQQNCIETPVGFKFIAEKIVEGDAQIGGEESGGIGIIDHIPERDGFLTALLLLELMAVTGKKLGQIYQDVCEEIRPYEFIRLDLHVPRKVMDACLARLQEDPPSSWNGQDVEHLETMDGFKFYMKDGSWLLIRPSGTEPIFRLYGETESEIQSQKLVEEARTFVESCT